ncbi:hypothetical protein CLV70_12237 [Pseudosporangium ferrugineum]|uniref:CopC domain-containing protein n=1 Tax=Pseudosporangium ferrugineum TaxID=439699 RepID=A0A2T0RI12_9ACTN|nr:copper resistance CopC family protein [Pseudosporangium ferrugineum]PRY20798.1 hypothetical protein CLV70_12237 [Pseudosporangium ferrugineum]
MRRLLLALAAVLAVLLPGTPARAHNQLVAAEPARDATLAEPPDRVALTFLQRLNPRFTTIVVSDGAKRRVPASAPVVDGAKGTVTFTAPLGEGAYTVAYRVVSVDGHTVQGSYSFAVASGPAGPVPAPPSGAAGAAGPAAESGGMPGGVPVALGAAVLVVAAGLAFRYVARRRASARV